MTRMVGGFQFQQYGGAEVLEWVTLPLAEPGPGEVLVEHHAVGVNFIDIYHREGLYPTGLPSRLGLEAAGVVAAVGPGVDDLAPGDRVSYCMAPLGAYAEAHVVPAARVLRLPDGIDFESAAAVTLKGLTAAFLLHSLRPFERGDAVLVHAAAGGVGQLLCQWGRALGLQVIGLVGSAAKAELALRAGCSEALVYGAEGLAERVRQLSGGQGVCTVFDSVGKDSFELSLDCLAPRGWLVSYGNASGAVPPVAPLTLAQRGSLVLTRPTLADFVASRDELEHLAGLLFSALEAGDLTVNIGQRLPLADAAEAQRRLQARETVGATVLLLNH